MWKTLLSFFSLIQGGSPWQRIRPTVEHGRIRKVRHRAIRSNSKSLRCFYLATVCLLASVMSSLSAQVTTSKPMPAKVIVRVGQTGTDRVPDTIFGSFLEPIGNSINNGIDAEILVNPSLEGGLWNHVNLENMFREQPELIQSSNSTGIPLPWESVNSAAGNRFELHVGDAANSWQSLEIMGQPNELTGIMQRVYLPVHRILVYKVSLYAKHLSGPATIRVSFRDRQTNKVLAEERLEAASTSWTKYKTTIRLPTGAVQPLEAVNFAVTVKGEERVDVDQVSLMPADAIGILDPDAVSMAKAMHLTELRFGGNFSSSYHWRSGIGPMDKRLTMENIAWGIPEYNDFGTNEFLQLCALIGATPQFDLNMGSGSAEEAADWVRYIHAHYKGHVIYELGNELYGKWQIGYPTVEQIGSRTLQFSRAVRAIDPDAEIIATGLGPIHGEAWNAAELKNPPGTFNDLSLHFIVGTNHPELHSSNPEFVAEAAYAIPYAVGPYLAKMQAQVDQHPEDRGKVHLAITEWLFNSKGPGERNFVNDSPSWMNAGGAIMAAGFLNTILRHVKEVKLTDMTGLMEFAGIWKRREQVYAMPAYYVFQMYTTVKGDTVLPVTTDSGSYNVMNGDRPFNQLNDIPYIDVVATRSKDQRTVTLLCVNRSLDGDTPVAFDLGALEARGSVQSEQIRAANWDEVNDDAMPQRVAPTSSTIHVPTGMPFTVVLPHDSVTVLRVPVQ